MSKCSMIIKTRSLKFDDRLRKECISLRNKGIEPRIVVLTQENEKKRSKTDYGVSYHSISLLGRKIFPHKRFLSLKIIEMYIKFFTDILKKRSNIVWVHNMELAGVIPFVWMLKKVGFIDKIIWDQHELPEMSMLPQNMLLKVYTYMCSLSDNIITANEPRKEYVKKYINNPDKIIVLENYPDKIFVNLAEGVLPDKARIWLEGKDFLLAQGGANPDRNLENLVEAVIQQQTYKLIIVGPYQEEQLKQLRQKWGKVVDKYVLFYGAVPQMSLVNFIDHAKASIIFYESHTMNTWLCAPNRLYQALGRGTPVIVGANPPMSELVHQFKCGAAIEDDGSSAKNILKGIQKLTSNYEDIIQNVQKCKKNWIWETQGKYIERLIPPELSEQKKPKRGQELKQI